MYSSRDMFTGLVEAVGRVAEVKATSTGNLRLRIETALAGELAPGDSLAVNGVCLTATLAQDGEVHADIGPETARVTTLGGLAIQTTVNLERPMRGDGRFGGHFVQGHVDTIGTVDEIRAEGDAHWITISYPPEFAGLLVRKGSIAIDGISLTVAGLDARRFDAMIIPFTWSHTNLARLHVGERVNLEFDMVGKYVARAAELARQTQ
jgi:riboflavin synthase